jgi:hypothetical protein
MFRVRPWIRRVAATLVITLCTGVAALPHTEGFDDFACAPVFVGHDESAHYIGAAPTTNHVDGEHCFLCHSLRSFHPGFEKFIQRNFAVRAERLHTSPVALADRLDWSLVPGRAPPV